MFSVPQSPCALIGRQVILPCGTSAEISEIFNLTSGIDGCEPAWIVEVSFALRERECLYDPLQGISLTGKRLHPLSELGRSIWIAN